MYKDTHMFLVVFGRKSKLYILYMFFYHPLVFKWAITCSKLTVSDRERFMQTVPSEKVVLTCCLCFILFQEQTKAHKQLHADPPSQAPFEHNKHKAANHFLFVLQRQWGIRIPHGHKHVRRFLMCPSLPSATYRQEMPGKQQNRQKLFDTSCENECESV